MDWSKLRIFYHVAQCGGFSHATQHSGMSQPSISRMVSLLEAEAQVQLFIRSSRGVTLTKQGELLYGIVKPFFSDLQSTLTRIRSNDDTLEGPLKVIVPSDYLSLYLTPVLSQFIKTYPGIKLTVQHIESIPDLDLYEADIIVHSFYQEHKPALTQHRIQTLQYSLYASDSYLKQYGIPQSIEDLDLHHLIGYSGSSQSMMDWHLHTGTQGHKREVVCSVSSIVSGIELAQADIGIVTAPRGHPLIADSGLTEILPDISSPKVDIYFSCLKHLESLKTIEVFKNYLIKALGK